MAFKDPDKAKAYYAKWRRENRARRNEVNKIWVKANPDKCNAANKRWKKANPEKVRQHQIAQYLRDPEKAKARMRKHHLARTYGLTVAQYDAMVATQQGVCAICNIDTPGKHKSWSIDHCHATGAIRGLLCHACNVALGCMQDNPAALRAAADYVEVAHRKNFNAIADFAALVDAETHGRRT